MRLIIVPRLPGVDPQPDTTPNAFTFSDQSGVATSAQITSAAITVSGTTAPAAITVSGGTYDVNASGSFVSTPGTVNSGDTVRVRHTSSASNSTATNTVLTIGGVSDTFTSTTVASGGSDLVHGASFTVTGSSLADQSSSTQIWDDCSTGVFTSKWSGGWPTNSGSAANLAYRTPNGTIALPHSNVTRYLDGAHDDGGLGVGFASGYNVAAWHTYTRPSFPYWTVLTWYERVDTRWTNQDVGGAPLNYQNWKWYAVSVGNNIYADVGGAQCHYYIGGTSEPSGDFQNGGGPFDVTLNDDSDLGTNGTQDQTVYGGPQNNPCTAWVKKSIITKHSNLTNQGRIIVQCDNGTPIDYTGFNDQWTTTTRSIGFGGYSNAYPFDNNRRYFADMHLLRTAQNGSPGRIELCNSATYSSATIREIQPWVSTSTTSWTLTCNKGRLSSGTVHVHYRDELSGSQYLGTRTIA